MSAPRDAIDLEIGASRQRIAQFEASGKTIQRAMEEARLGGLLAAWSILGGHATVCVHPRHTPSGFDESGRTIWRCLVCGVVA